MCGELNPGPLPCEGSVIPLHHTPVLYNSLAKILFFKGVKNFKYKFNAKNYANSKN